MNATRERHGRQRGFTLVVATFLLVVLSALGAFAVRLTTMQQHSVNSALLAAQALHAARSGIAWAANRAIDSGWCATATLTLTESGTDGFAVEVSCAQTTHVESGTTIDVYLIDVLAEFGSYGDVDYVSRRLEAKIMDAG